MVQSAGDKLLEVIIKQSGKVIYFSQAENISPNVAVHEARKSFKRIRALLRFYPVSESDYPLQVSRQLAKYGKELSPFRNSWVNIQILEKIAGENPQIPERKLRFIKDQLAETNKVFLKQQFAENEKQVEIRKFLSDFEQHFSQRMPGTSAKYIAEQFNQAFLKSYNLFKEENIFGLPERLHELRKKLKRLMYQSNFLKFIDARFFKIKSDQLHIITETLGNDHDLYVFLKEITKKEYDLTPEEIVVLENKVNHLREVNLPKCQARLKQFFSETPGEFAEKLSPVFAKM